MPERNFNRTSSIQASRDELRDWHFRPGAFLRLNPPWEKANVIESPESLADGARAVIELEMGPFRPKWVAEHHLLEDGFVDTQVKGPFAAWRHEHHFLGDGETSRLTDDITYRAPFGILGDTFGGWMIRRKLEKMFRYRHEVTKQDLERRTTSPPPRPLVVLMTGGSGLIGKNLTGYLQTQGHTVHNITRTPKAETDIYWDAEESLEIPKSIQPDAVIHLAGANVAEGRWTEGRKRTIMESRVEGTGLLVDAVLSLPKAPSTFVSASGSGYYEFGGEAKDETSPQGEHFLSDVCERWESALAPIEEAGIRTIKARIGAVLTPAGGALEKMLPAFRFGLGGAIGDGNQRLSWISMDDTIDVFHRCLFEDSWTGPINLTAPEIVSNRQFTTELAAALKRPAFLPVPQLAIKAIFGEMAEETILADIAVAPSKLLSYGYKFRHPTLRSALTHGLGAPPVS